MKEIIIQMIGMLIGLITYLTLYIIGIIIRNKKKKEIQKFEQIRK